MAAQVYYFSTNTPAELAPYSVAGIGASGSLNQGTTSTDVAQTTDYFQLSIKTVMADGSTLTNVTKRDVVNFLRACERWLVASSRGPATAPGDGGEGLDYVIKANSGTVGVP